MKGLKQVFKLAFSQKKSAYLTIISNLFFVIFNLVSLVLFIPFLNLIFKEEILENAIQTVKPSWSTKTDIFQFFSDYYNYWMADFIQTHGKVGALAFICITVLLAFFLKNFFRYGAIYHQSYMRMAVVRELRLSMYKKSIRLPLSYHSEEKKGDLLSRMTSDLNEIEIAVVYALEIIFREPLAIIISLSVLFYWSAELTLFSLILLPISAFLISRIGKSLKRTSQKGQTQMGRLLSQIEESITGVRIIKAFSAEKQSEDRFTKENTHHQELITRAFRKKDLASPLNEFLGAAVLVCIVWFGGKIILENTGDENQFTGGEFMAFIIVFSQLLRPISGVANGIASMKKAEASLDRINEVLNIEEKIKDNEKSIDKNEFLSELKFENVHFSYNETPVLKNISFTLEKGKTIALVGESGSGKSTIADLIPRFYDIEQGEIKVDNENIKNISQKSLRKLIGFVNQESILFNDTIANNIAFGKPNATIDEIVEAAKIANAHEFIEKMENGYESNIGDRGNKLSGGQKQRISIARAVLTNAPIMILDEATSALDTESEKLVQNALDNLMKNRTSIVIAHRLSTIKNADCILVLKNGEIVEQGNHIELIKNNGYYKILCDIQEIN